MELIIVSESGEKKSVKGKAEVKKKLQEKPFLHHLFNKGNWFVNFDSVSKKFFVMDEDAFNVFGKKLLARHRKLPFQKLSPNFHFFAPVITSKCNLACSYCFGWEKNRSGTNSSWVLIKSAVDYLAGQNERIVVSFFSPGEQTGDFELFKKTLAYVKKKLKIKRMVISTNGTGNYNEYLSFMDEFNTFQISFDGPPEIQDAQRPLKGGGKSSMLVEKTIKKLIKHNKKFKVKATITNLHWGKEERTFKYFYDLGIKDVAFSTVSALGSGIKYLKQTYYKTVKTELKIKELCDSFGMNARLAIEQLIGLKETPFCGIGYTFNIGTNGSIASCSIYSDKSDLKLHNGIGELLIGQFDFKTKKFKINMEKVEKLRNAHKKDKCYDCDFKLCWGGCPLRNLQNTGSILEPDKKYCEERKTETRALMKYWAEKNVIKIKPCLEEKNGKLFYSMQFNEFRLSESNGKKLGGNPLIRFSPSETSLEKLLEIILLNDTNKKGVRLFLLSPSVKGRLDARNTILFKEFLFALKKNKVLFKITKPVKITDYGPKEEAEFYKTFSIPKNCFECLEMFKVKDGRIEYCNGRKGAKISEVFDREAIYSVFEKDSGKIKCSNVEKCSNEPIA